MPERAHEPSDVPIRATLAWTAGAAGMIALALAILFAVFRNPDPGPAPQTVWQTRPQEGPRLQIDPAEERRVLEARDRALLEDGPLSIEAAMDEVAAAGWREGNRDPSPAAEVAAENPDARALDDLAREADLARDPRDAAEAMDADPGGQER